MHKSYVIRTGHFTTSQKKAYNLLSEKFVIPYSENEINFNSIFGNNAGVTLEIGFGSGKATAQLAQTNPEKNYLGVEVHRPGIGRLLWEIEKRCLTNIRIIEHDAVFVIEKMIPASSLQAIHLFFPDPWQKKRHHKRRLVQRPFLNILAERIKPEGYFYMVTDWEDYAHFALEELSTVSSLKNSFNDFSPPQSWRPVTNYEEKGLAKNHLIKELYYIKI
jgi:tRNA (guanine-N7-)-methyltransferase